MNLQLTSQRRCIRTATALLLSTIAWTSPAEAIFQPEPNSGAGPVPTAQPAPTAADALARGINRAGPAIGPEIIGPIGPIGPLEPEISDGVYPPLDFNIAGYGTNRVALRWWYKGGAQTQIWRSSGDGPWSVIQTLGELTRDSYIDYQDQSALINAENCYRVSISDGVNPGSRKSSPIRCVMTRDGRAMPVRRLQLRLRISNIANAGTDNPVEVRLQSPSWLVTTVTNW